jgi:hypothetical protein
MRPRGLIATCITVLALTAAPAARASSTVISVNSTADIGLTEHAELCGQGKGPLQGFCTLRAAMEVAEGFHGIPLGAEGVVVSVPAGHYYLATHRPLPAGDVLEEACRGSGGAAVSCPVTVQGAGADATTIDGEGATGLLTIEHGAGPVTISGFTLRGSSSAAGAVADHEGAPALISDSRLAENEAGTSGGAAVQLENATMTILRSALAGNRAQRDGAVEVSGGSLSLERSSLTGNTAVSGGSAIGALEGARVKLLDTTVAANAAASGGAVAAGAGSSLDLAYSTVDGGAGPAVSAAGPHSVALEGSILTGAAALACAGPAPVVALGPNILDGGVSACALSGVTPIVADPLLGAPTAQGIVAVLPLLRGSPALNSGGASCPASAAEGAPVDERGIGRPLGAGCDIGAFESAADAAVALAAGPAPTAGTAFSIVATVSDPGADGLSGVSVTFALPVLANLANAPLGCVATFGFSPQLMCPVGTVPSGATRAVTVQMRPLTAETLGFAAGAQADQADYAPDNDSAALAVPVRAAAVVLPAASLVSHVLKVDREWNALARVRCIGSGVPCTTTLGLYPQHGPIVAQRAVPAAKLLASARSTIGAGRTVVVAIHLSKPARRALRLRRRARGRLMLATGAAPVRRALQVVTLLKAR